MKRCPKMTSSSVGKRASITPARTMPGESPSEVWSWLMPIWMVWCRGSSVASSGQKYMFQAESAE